MNKKSSSFSLSLSLVNLVFTCVVAQKNPNFFADRNTIINLFEWKWEDIRTECQQFLTGKSYAGVQISPPNENVIAPKRPWWERYQPVSYNLTTRSGNQEQFQNMLAGCNTAGIRIYADIVVNHMAALTGIGTAGNAALSDVKMYPALPFDPQNFHPTCDILNYNSAATVRNCELNHLRDLNQADQGVEDKIVEYLDGLIVMGIAGFRIDSAKYMQPEDLMRISRRLRNLSTAYGFPTGSRPFIYQDIPNYGADDVVTNDEYVGIGTVEEFQYTTSISRVFTGKLNLSQLENFGPDWGFVVSGDALISVDNHANQRKEGVLNYKNPRQYKMALAFMLAHDYGIPRVLSSYFFDTADIGPPQDTDENIKSPIIYSDGSCGNGYVCEHRWPQVYNMVEFRQTVQGTAVQTWWTNEDNGQQIAFSRGNRGFVAFSNAGDLVQGIQTSLPGGVYCDVISGYAVGGSCTGKSVIVNGQGVAEVSITSKDFDSVVAVHVNSKIS